MQTLKLNEIREWDVKAIDAKVKELRSELFGLKMSKAASGIEKPHFLRVAKKNIAKLLTVKKQKMK